MKVEEYWHGTMKNYRYDGYVSHTNREYWVFKQADKLNAENKEKGSQSNDDDAEPRPPNTGG